MNINKLSLLPDQTNIFLGLMYKFLNFYQTMSGVQSNFTVSDNVTHFNKINKKTQNTKCLKKAMIAKCVSHLYSRQCPLMYE